MNRQIGDRAVVLGAGMAGLLATRVLADSYGQVTVIDRDELPQTPMHRRGVPTAATCMRWRREGSRPWRNCSPGLPRSWSPTGRRSGTC
jgi:2-polyprenyl-6-methoxyphenol hydroxylase-like FAD-dependent oxidoreductase